MPRSIDQASTVKLPVLRSGGPGQFPRATRPELKCEKGQPGTTFSAAGSERAPLHAQAVVPVHGDCHWGNWLACDQSVMALLDFEWARFGEPADDWFFLARFSGPHMETVLDVIAHATAPPAETLRAECEVRDAAYLVSDLRVALERPDFPAGMAADRLRGLEELIIGRYWWRHTG